MADGDDFWKAPAEALGPLIPFVPMTEKYLRRPPFRFVHDIVAGLQRELGTFKHAPITDAEWDANNIDSKDAKVDFLKKVVQCVENGLGRSLDINPKKIVSGSDCEKTAVFLCDLATFARGDSKRSPSNGGEVPSAPAPPPPPPPPGAEGSKHQRPPPSLRIDNDMLAAADEASKHAILEDAMKFQQQLQSKGLGLDDGANPALNTQIASDIRMMELELKATEIPPTEPSNMTAENLEKALARQLEMIKQIDELALENHALMERIVRSTAP
jgi:hypothetical protein